MTKERGIHLISVLGISKQKQKQPKSRKTQCIKKKYLYIFKRQRKKRANASTRRHSTNFFSVFFFHGGHKNNWHKLLMCNKLVRSHTHKSTSIHTKESIVLIVSFFRAHALAIATHSPSLTHLHARLACVKGNDLSVFIYCSGSFLFLKKKFCVCFFFHASFIGRYEMSIEQAHTHSHFHIIK